MVRVFRAMHKQGGSKGSTITEDDGDGKGCAALQQPANVTAKQINVDDDKVRPFVRATDRAISKQTREAFNIGLEVCSMFFPLVAMVRVDLSNPNTLTPEEAAEIQSITDKYNTNIDVVDSRAASRGCNVATDLPVARGQINAVILISDTMLATRRQRALGQTSRDWEEAGHEPQI